MVVAGALIVIAVFFIWMWYIGIRDDIKVNRAEIKSLKQDAKQLKQDIGRLRKSYNNKKYKVEIRYYELGEVKTTIIPDVIEIEDNSELDGFAFKRANKLILKKTNGEFIINAEDIISVDKTEQ